MPIYHEVAIAHYGHPLLRVKHWAIVVVLDAQQTRCIAYQITGSTDTYEIKPPEPVTLTDTKAYLGKVRVGHVEHQRLHAFSSSLASADRVIRGDKGWNCQNWVVDSLEVLKRQGHIIMGDDVEDVSKKWLSDSLEKAVREDAGEAGDYALCRKTRRQERVRTLVS